MKAIHAIYEGGVFRPLDQVEGVEEGKEVVLDLRQVPPRMSAEGRQRVYEILSRRYDSGETDLAARHDEHEP